MTSLQAQRLGALQSHTDNIRNICILAHVDHGKTTLSDSLLTTNGVISAKLAGKIRYLDSREDEQERGITMESSGISLYFKVLRRSASSADSTEASTTPPSASTSTPPADSTPSMEAHEYLINLIDSPGHVDFSSEVSTASRLCDGALVLVDVIEGVCTQTITVLKQAWTENVRPVLVLNKMDRLITEWQMTPTEAYQHMCQILEQVNAVMATFLTGEILEADARKLDEAKLKMLENAATDGPDTTLDWALKEIDDSQIYFSPELGNVIFASAIHGWSFGISHFAQLYAAKLKIRESVLRTTLWGDYYLDPKTKRIVPHKALKGRALKPLFVQFVLENIWAAYDAVIIHPDQARIEKIVQALKLKFLPRDLRTKDSQALIMNLMSQWLPLSTAVFLAVIEKLPSPRQAQQVRIPKLLYPFDDDVAEPKNDLERAMFECDTSESAPITIYVSKMFSVPVSQLPENQRRQLSADELRARGRVERIRRQADEANTTGLTGDGQPIPMEQLAETTREPQAETNSSENDQALIGFCRIYSGTVREGQEMYALSPKYDHTLPVAVQSQYVHRVTVGKLYLLMGRDLLPVPQVMAGNVFAMAGLGDQVLKSATISTSLECPSLGSILTTSAPIVRAALEPARLSEMSQLVHGLKLLNQSDPCVEVYLQETGEHVIATAGELHLERCLTDLRERFARIEIHVSPPLVPFRETVAPLLARGGQQPPAGESMTVTTSNGVCDVTISCRPLPATVVAFLAEHRETIKQLWTGRNYPDSGEDAVDTLDTSGVTAGRPGHQRLLGWYEFRVALEALFREDEVEHKSQWGAVVDNIWLCGPKRIGPNLFINNLADYQPKPVTQQRSKHATGPVSPDASASQSDAPTLSTEALADRVAQLNVAEEPRTATITLRDLEESVATGFQLATLNGPLCAEPVVGLCFTLEGCQIHSDRLPKANGEKEGSDESATAAWSVLKNTLPGQVIMATREACRQSFLSWSPRLMLAMYSVEIQATSEVLGKVYAVIAKRRGRIISEEMKDGTSLFQVQARLPVVESFGFADDIRKRTSGAASPQLLFSGFEILEEDPFWVPTTEEELEDLGEKSDRENLAKKYVDSVRKRKGMFVEKKIVESAEKQRTLKK
ncbi:hypothetical protein BJ085DRAFT_18730 [Dimargaris cristalligena]|uniref:Ribosome assembly protein 1 n=1 Tax=Dimargaris cristalligena TaxID=215637 RepID=A0A4Q0A2H5_9FUNG|nr:hypothetical protein BJ085DRAFT_18730 [Dimargaris cristalligena]|eukprot:RKP40315.1 hypothetical protein BJ085DRAFT_18730 [Dimargaris cristalligena]